MLCPRLRRLQKTISMTQTTIELGGDATADAPLAHTTFIDYERPWMYPKQLDAIFTTARIATIEATTKGGKTLGCIAWLVEQAMMGGGNGRNYWWVAPVTVQAEIAFTRLVHYLPHGAFTATRAQQRKTVVLVNGAVIWFKSADKPDCYDDQTEILTDQGWKYFRELTGHEAVMTRRLGTGVAEWQMPSRIVHCRYSGEMVAIENERIDACVTPNHRMLVERRRGAVRRGKWRRNGPRSGNVVKLQEMIVEAEALGHDRIPGQCTWFGNDDERLTHDACAFMGFYLAEGSAIWNSSDRPYERVKRSGYRIHLAQVAGRKGGDKGDVRQQMIALLQRMGLSFKERKDGVLLWDKGLWHQLIVLGNKYTKRIPPEFKNLPPDKLKTLLHWMILGDGWMRQDCCAYFTVSRQLADDVQEIAIKCGWSATIRQRASRPYPRPGKPGRASIGYIVNIQKRTKSHYLRGPQNYVRRMPYDGAVYCVSVPNGIVLVRRNGKPLWSGNSLYGDDVHAAVLDEASRMKEAAWHAVRTTLTATQGPVRIIGNVKGRKNWFYSLARHAEQNGRSGRGTEPDLDFHRIVAADAVEAGVIPPSEIEAARRDLPEAVFRELYLAEAGDDGGNPFGSEHIKGCTVAELSREQPMWWGWDLAKRQDYTVGIGLDHAGRTCRFERFHRIPWPDIMLRIINVTGSVPALVDSTGVGDPVVDQLKRTPGSRFEGYHFTAASKQKLMEGLAVAIQSRTVAYPPGEIVTELDQFEYEIKRTSVHYSAPAGLNDDCVVALSLAVMCRSVMPPTMVFTEEMLRQVMNAPRTRWD